MKLRLSKKEKEALEGFRIDICDKSEQVDPTNEWHWYAISLGYFIGKGISINRAHDLSTYARYDLQYWDPIDPMTIVNIKED